MAQERCRASSYFSSGYSMRLPESRSGLLQFDQALVVGLGADVERPLGDAPLDAYGIGAEGILPTNGSMPLDFGGTPATSSPDWITKQSACS